MAFDWLFGPPHGPDIDLDGDNDDDWSPGGWRDIPTQTVAINQLEPGQDWLDEDFVDDLADNPSIRPYGGDRPVWVVEDHGRLTINDGHHRVAAARARGQRSISVRIRRWRGQHRRNR